MKGTGKVGSAQPALGTWNFLCLDGVKPDKESGFSLYSKIWALVKAMFNLLGTKIATQIIFSFAAKGERVQRKKQTKGGERGRGNRKNNQEDGEREEENRQQEGQEDGRERRKRKGEDSEAQRTIKGRSWCRMNRRTWKVTWSPSCKEYVSSAVKVTFLNSLFRSDEKQREVGEFFFSWVNKEQRRK